MSDKSPAIAAIILQYGQWQATRACIASLLQNLLQPRWIIVVDNASPDGSASRIEEYLRSRKTAHGNSGESLAVLAGAPRPGQAPDARLILINLKENRGYAAGNNAGLRLALDLGAKAFLILNNDTVARPEAVGALWQRLRECPRPGLCGALLAYPLPGEPVQCMAGGHTNYFWGLSRFAGAGLGIAEARGLDPVEVEKKLNFICGACVMASRQFVEQVGLMDEGYFLYCEEQDWALRAQNRFDLAYAPQALVYHHEGASTGWSRHSFQWRQSLRLARSRLRLAWLHHPQYLPSVACSVVFAAMRLCMRKIIAKMRKK